MHSNQLFIQDCQRLPQVETVGRDLWDQWIFSEITAATWHFFFSLQIKMLAFSGKAVKRMGDLGGFLELFCLKN